MTLVLNPTNRQLTDADDSPVAFMARAPFDLRLLFSFLSVACVPFLPDSSAAD